MNVYYIMTKKSTKHRKTETILKPKTIKNMEIHRITLPSTQNQVEYKVSRYGK